MKRALSDIDTAACEVARKHRRYSLSATHPDPTPAKWAAVISWLRAEPLGASAEELRMTPPESPDAHTYSIPTMDPRSLSTRRDRKLQTRKQSVSPTKKPTEYRSITSGIKQCVSVIMVKQ